MIRALRKLSQRVGLDPDLPILALCPGAEFGAAKRWPPEYYAEVARDYLCQGWQVALYGSANDREVCAQIRRDAGEHRHCHDLAGRTSLAEAVDLLSLSTAVISNDSGLMHIAAALQRPLLAIYGATSPDFTPPLSSVSALLLSDIDCAPCFQRECPLGHHRCMRDTAAALAAAKLERCWPRSEGSLRVLVVKMSSLGDVIHTLPALSDAAQALPGIRLTGWWRKPLPKCPPGIRRWTGDSGGHAPLAQTAAADFRGPEWRRARSALRASTTMR